MIVVTGRPGSGKSTLASMLGEALCMPAVSRDRIKEGYCRTVGKGHSELPAETNAEVNAVFSFVLAGLAGAGVSAIAEAAFQHRVWSELLAPFMQTTRLRVIICAADGAAAYARYVERGKADARRAYYHGDAAGGLGINCAAAGLGANYAAAGLGINCAAAGGPAPYDEPKLGAPTFRVDTTAGYSPSFDELRELIL